MHANHNAPHNRAHQNRRKKRNREMRRAILALAAVILLGLLALVPLMLSSNRVERKADPASAMVAESLAPMTLEAQITPLPQAQPTAIPTAEPTAAPTLAPMPTAAPEPTIEPTAEPVPFEYLPVAVKADTDKKRIAITVDDCYQVENLNTIVNLAVDNRAKLTLFPVGENIGKAGMADILKRCVFDLGFEIENHTWSHARVFRLPEDEMAAEIWKQRRALNLALGVDYEQHLFRLMGGDGVNDQRLHNYLRQLGYLGIAEWSLSGSDAKLATIEKSLAPGMVYLFHTTDADTKKLKQFIPWVRAQGYEMVTMNELFGAPDNAVSDLTDEDMPAPQPFDVDYRTHRKGDYAWIIVQMQDVLRDQGYLEMDGPSTGYYGDQTEKAVADYQRGHGLEATGEADEATQKSILGIERS